MLLDFSYTNSNIEPDDGYISAAETFSCFHMCDKIVYRL
jgi:hypothetical protein